MSALPADGGEGGPPPSLMDHARFHDAQVLIPADQDLMTVSADQSVSDLLAVMIGKSYSQVPVKMGPRVAGMVTVRSLLAAVHVREPDWLDRLDITDVMEPATFLQEGATLDEVFAHLALNEVALVGHPGQLLGIVTPTDMIGFLKRIADPFVLVREIELGVRHMIRSCLSEAEIAEAARMVLSGAYAGRPDGPPATLDGMTLSDEIALLTTSRFRTQLSRGLGKNPSNVATYLSAVPQIRNDIFHFKRDATPADVDDLIKARMWLFNRIQAMEADVA